MPELLSNRRLNDTRFLVITAAILSNVLILCTDSLILQFASSLILTCLLPGFILISALFPRADAPNPVERIVLSVGAGYALLILGGWGIHSLPGPVTSHLVLLVYDCLIALLLIPYSLRRGVVKRGNWSKSAIWQIVMIVVLASSFRFTYLGYSEFQGDETTVLLKGVGVIQGKEDVLFRHKKGPAEILTPTVLYALTGRINEFTARFPFALANVTGIVAIYLIGKAMFGDRVGLAAGLLLGINGYFIAFARIVQYQSIILLMMALSILCYYRFYREENGARLYQILGTLFLGVGLLAHYDAVFAVPVVAFLCLRKFRSRPHTLGDDLPLLLVSSFLILCLLLAFYVPFVRHSYFEKAQSYLAARTGVESRTLYNNLGKFFVISTFYNSTYYIVFLMIMLGVVVIKQLMTVSSRKYIGPLLSFTFIAGLLAILIFPSWWQVGGVNVTIGFFSAFLLILLVSPVPSVELKSNLIWFALPFLFYDFLIASPRTHFYVFFPPLALIGGLVIEKATLLPSRYGGDMPSQTDNLQRAVGLSVCAALYLVFAYYVYMVFVQHDPEYKRTYPEHKSKYYWTIYDDELPRAGWFGFPYRAGWKVIGYLYREGILRGDYFSNEEDLITEWYTRGEWRCFNNPRYYFIAKNVQDVVSIDEQFVKENYGLIGTVQVNGEPKLWIYERSPTTSPHVTYELAQYASAFDEDISGPAFPIIWLPVGDPVSIEHPIEANLENKARLLGFDLDDDTVEPGGVLMLTLYWQATTELTESYNVFTHVETDRIWGQKDYLPVCSARPTTSWTPGEIIVDRYSVTLDPSTPVGQYPLLVGMYELSTGRRLAILDEKGEVQGDSVFLQRVTVTQTH
jgi:4-amino-4-deoxy-L-arabinose transferase-like glycosyltransferase